MNIKFKLFFLIITAFSLISSTQRPIHIFMAGDSTMADKVLFKNVTDSASGSITQEEFLERGWGQLLPDFFTDKIIVKNLAQNGRSTRTFISEGWWEKIISEVQKGDYVIIQFGHNDSSVEKKDRYTSPDDYRLNLISFIDQVKAKGGNPILCTAVMRRKFDATGILIDTHGVYPDIVRQVAKDKKVLLIDLHKATASWLNKEGITDSKHFFHKFAPGVSKLYPKGLDDNTHFNEKGARIVAGFFIEELKKQNVKPLTNLLKDETKPYISKVWVSDLGDGKYQNPILNADYSDPDVCRVGDNYYMTASSFNCIPGLPILHSNDLVNWKLINYAVQRLTPDSIFSKPQHGNGVWAPSIRFHKDEYYIYYGDPDQGIFMTKTKNPAGDWEPLVLVIKGKGLIDPCPLWDDEEHMYLVHAFAGSRAGIKSLLAVTKLSDDGKKIVGTERIVYDGHESDQTIEGPKFYKRNGYYYILAPAGGVATGWQVVLRSKNIFGPYVRKVVLAQGKTIINGPHQGAWVDTKTGENWFLHFQDVGAIGRVVHLQPMVWKNDFPIIGTDSDGDGCGEPVLTYQKPNTSKNYPVTTPIDNDEFNTNTLGLQWQWHANPQTWWYFADQQNSRLSLYAVPLPSSYKNLWDVPNLLLQKFPSNAFTATLKLTLKPDLRFKGERTGLLVFGLNYALLSFESVENGFMLSQNSSSKADKGTPETIHDKVLITTPTVFLRVTVSSNALCNFSFSLDNKIYTPLGVSFIAKEGKWIGAKIGTFCSRPSATNDGGRVDIDWFRFEK